MACATTSIRKLMSAGPVKAKQLWESTRALHGGLTAAGFTLATETPESAIISVLMPDQEMTVRMWQAMLERSVYVNMSRPPATPMGVFLLRCSLCAEHTPDQVKTVLATFKAAASDVGRPLKSVVPPKKKSAIARLIEKVGGR
jgi:7-keto-8-aminopelargonate synthetase-like enzyme